MTHLGSRNHTPYQDYSVKNATLLPAQGSSLEFGCLLSQALGPEVTCKQLTSELHIFCKHS